MRRRKGFMKIDMHGVDAEIAWPYAAGNRVEVCTVAIEIGAGAMRPVRHFLYAPLEEAARVGVGEHDGGDVGTELFLEDIGVNMPVSLRRNLVDDEARERRRGGICSVCGRWHQNA